MTDLSRLLRDALPSDPVRLDLSAVTARSSQLVCRRRAVAAVGVATGVVVATAAVALAVGAPSQRADRLGPATAPITAPSAGPKSPLPSPALPAASAAKQEACRHVRLAAVEYAADALRDGVDFAVVEAEMSAAWRAGRSDRDPEFVRGLVSPGTIAPGDTQTLGDATSRLAGLCGLTPTGLKAPTAQRLDRTDEFGSVSGTERLDDGRLRVQVNHVDWLPGDEAQAAAAANGTDADDYYVVDDSPRTRTYDISPAAKVYGSIQLTGVPDLAERTLDDLTRFLSEGSSALRGQNVQEQVRATYFHFQLQDGVVVGIEEQYRP